MDNRLLPLERLTMTRIEIVLWRLLPLTLLTGYFSLSNSTDLPITKHSTSSYTNQCLADGLATETFRDFVESFLSKNDSIATSIRHGLLLPAMPPATVVIETDSVVCRSVRRAVDSMFIQFARGAVFKLHRFNFRLNSPRAFASRSTACDCRC